MAVPLPADLLLKALRDEGLTVVQVGNWRTHNRNHKGPWGPMHGVMIHHTVTSGTAATVRICRDGYEGLPGPLCHGVIDKQGRVHLVGYGRANHAGLGDDDVLRAVINEQPLPPDNEANTDGNRHFYGFECENLGDGQDPWPDVQLEAIEKAAAAVCRVHGWNARSVIGHLEWQPGKIDPRGFEMDSMRARIGARISGTPTSQEEDPMAGMSKQDIYDAVWKLDQIAAPKDAADYATNKTWQPQSILKDLQARIRSMDKRLAAQTAAITALAAQLGEDVDTATVVAAVRQAIADAVIKVDVDVTSAS